MKHGKNKWFFVVNSIINHLNSISTLSQPIDILVYERNGRLTWMGYGSDGAWEKLPVRSVTFSVGGREISSQLFQLFLSHTCSCYSLGHLSMSGHGSVCAAEHRSGLSHSGQISGADWPRVKMLRLSRTLATIARTSGASRKQMPKGMGTPSDLLRFHIGVPSHQCRQRYRNTL